MGFVQINIVFGRYLSGNVFFKSIYSKRYETMKLSR